MIPSSPHPVLHAKVLHLISSPGLLITRESPALRSVVGGQTIRLVDDMFYRRL